MLHLANSASVLKCVRLYLVPYRFTQLIPEPEGLPVTESPLAGDDDLVCEPLTNSEEECDCEG